MLRPAYRLVVGDREFTQQALAVEVVRACAPAVGQLLVHLPYRGDAPVELDEEVSLALDGGEGEADVFTGRVHALQHHLGGLVLRASDASRAMARVRPVGTWQGQSAGDVLADICAQAGVEAGARTAGPHLPAYVADGSWSAWDHAARLAAWSEGDAFVAADGKVVLHAAPVVRGDQARKQGRDLLAVDHRAARPPDQGFVLAGEGPGPARDERVALKFTADFLGSPRAEGARVVHAAGLRDREAAQAAGRHLAGRGAAAATRVRLRLLLDPRLGPGTLLEVQDTAVPLPLLRLDEVRHIHGARGSWTDVRGVAAAPPAGALDLPGALGSLL